MLQNAHMPGKTADIISLIEKHDININSKHPESESGLTLFLVSFSLKMHFILTSSSFKGLV